MSPISRGVAITSLVAVAVAIGAAAEPPGPSDPLAEQQAQATRVDAALVAKGDSIYHGKLGGAICYVCHGQDAKGMPGMGPNLTDSIWLHGDGTLASIERTIRAGVAKPKASNAVMPPGGGVPLDSVRLRAVATYVYALRPRR